MLNHIRYMRDNASLCDQPSRLDMYEMIVGDAFRDRFPCKECTALLAAANRRHRDAELIEERNGGFNAEYIGDVKWIIAGAVAFTSGVWIGLFLLWYFFVQ